MPTWNQMAAGYNPVTLRGLISFFDRIGGPVDDASLAGALVALMRTTGWRYTTSALGIATALGSRRINCDEVADLLMCLYAYKNHPANVLASREHVHGPNANAPVFLPSVKIQHTGLKIALNVTGPVPGVFFNAGHRVAALGVARTCYDLISGHRGPRAAMELAYIRCNKLPRVPEVFQFDYMGGSILLTKKGGATAEGLSNYASSYGR